MKKFFIIFFTLAVLSSLRGYDLNFVSKSESEALAQRWLRFMNRIPFEEKTGTYSLKSIENIDYKGYPLGDVYHLSPRGHIVISSFREIVPVKSFSVVSDFNTQSRGYEWVVLEELRETLNFLLNYEKGKNRRVERALEENYREWSEMARMDFKDNKPLKKDRLYEKGKKEAFCYEWESSLGTSWQSILTFPLVRTRWDQGWPFNAQCPEISNQRTLAGCVAIAASQVVRYYQWPKKGKRKHSYEWKKKLLRADYNDNYDWQFMPSSRAKYNIPREEDAASELCYEMGVAVNMNYGLHGSGAYTRNVAQALKKYLRYKKKIKVVYRNPSYMDEEKWFKVFKREIKRARPVIFRIRSSNAGHAVVADGYLETKNKKGIISRKIHINMGWGGSMNSYYSLNKIGEFRKNEDQYALIHILPQHALVLSSPSRKQKVERGENFEVTWWSWSCSSSIKLELYRGTEFMETIKAEIVNNGAYLWNVPNYLPEASNYRIRIVDTNHPNRDYWGEFFKIN